MTFAPAPYPPGPPGGAVRLHGRTTLLWAAILGAVGVALAIAGGVLLATWSYRSVDSFARVSFSPGTDTVQFTRTGPYVGYYETPSGADHHALVTMVMLDPTGNHVPLGIYGKNDGDSSDSLTYDRDGHHGQALFTFTVDRPGVYTVAVRSQDAAHGADMAFGKSVAGDVAVADALLFPGTVLVVAAVVLLIIGLIRRGRHKAQLANPVWTVPLYGAQPYTWYPPGGGSDPAGWGNGPPGN